MHRLMSSASKSWFALVAVAVFCWPVHARSATSEEHVFSDPFAQATDGLRACPRPEPPHYTVEESRRLAHERSQRGVSCYLAGQCRLMNSYYYDPEIVPRVVIAVNADSKFKDTSVWVLGQRRWVYVKGCVSSEEQRAALLERVRNIDDVQMVIDELTVGVPAAPRRGR